MGNNIKREILRLLKEDYEFRSAIIGFLAEGLTTRAETKAIIEEIRNLREDFNKRMNELREDFNRRFEAFDKRMNELREDFNKRSEALDIKLSALGARWGILNEEAVRNALRGLLGDYFYAKVDKWEIFDEKGIVYGIPSLVEADVLITDSEHILVEIKSHVGKSDITELLRMSELYKAKTGVMPKLVIVSPYVDEKAREFAKMKNITIYSEKDLLR